MSAIERVLHCRNCKRVDISGGEGGYCQKCLYFIENEGGTIRVNQPLLPTCGIPNCEARGCNKPQPRFCLDCGVVVGLYEHRCYACTMSLLGRQEAKTLVVCPSCTKGVYALFDGVCTECAGKPLKPQRPSWDDYFFSMAALVATRATCPRASVGVVLVDGGHRVVATGYNGALPGEPHCTDVGCDIFGGHCMRARHGEASALATTDRLFTEADAVAAYVSAPLPVCTACARQLRDAGVIEVKWRKS